MTKELRFDGRTAIITGAGRGLGAAYAKLLASRGAQIVVNDLGDDADAVVADITNAGGKAVAAKVSVATEEGVSQIYDTAIDAFGKIDILVNNAGILRDRSLKKMTLQEFDDVLAVHLRGSFMLSQKVFAHMSEQKYGRIVMTTSVAGLYGNFGQANYSAAKMGLVGLARTLAQEGNRYGINVNVISPGALTAMTESMMDANSESVPDKVAPMVGYLCHEDCQESGAIYSSSGGRLSKVFVGQTLGVTLGEHTIEDVVQHLPEISDETGYRLPAHAFDS
jgi:NAD(P)-dependent dehydrogenase (short-subunit alcohol dehydrogenase family)